MRKLTLGAFDVIAPSAKIWQQERQLLTIRQSADATPASAFDGYIMLTYGAYTARYIMRYTGDEYGLEIDITDITRAVAVNYASRSRSNSLEIVLSLNTGDTLAVDMAISGLIEPEFIPPYPLTTDSLAGFIEPAGRLDNMILPPIKQIKPNRVLIR